MKSGFQKKIPKWTSVKACSVWKEEGREMARGKKHSNFVQHFSIYFVPALRIRLFLRIIIIIKRTELRWGFCLKGGKNIEKKFLPRHSNDAWHTSVIVPREFLVEKKELKNGKRVAKTADFLSTFRMCSCNSFQIKILRNQLYHP